MISNGPCSCLRLVHNGWRSNRPLQPAPVKRAQRRTGILHASDPKASGAFVCSAGERHAGRNRGQDAADCALRRASAGDRTRSPPAGNGIRVPVRAEACGIRVDIGSIDDGQPASSQAPGRDKVQHRESILGGALIIFVVRDQAATEIRREHLGSLESERGQRWICRSRRHLSARLRKVRECLISLRLPLDTREDSHLGRRTQHRVFRSNRQKAHSVAEALSHASSPRLKFRTRPLEAVILMAEFPGRQRLELDVILYVWRCHDHSTRFSELKENPLEGCEA